MAMQPEVIHQTAAEIIESLASVNVVRELVDRNKLPEDSDFAILVVERILRITVRGNDADESEAAELTPRELVDLLRADMTTEKNDDDSQRLAEEIAKLISA